MSAQIPGSYLSPTVKNRLVNYYATDPVYNAVRDLLGYLDSVKWYDGISDPVYELIQRSPSLVDVADSLSGKIIGDYFTRVSDLVSRHSNLTWLSDVERITDASELFNRRANITGLTDFVMGNTPSGASRWSRIQNYLNDEMYNNIQAILATAPPDLADIKSLIDALKAQANGEGVSFDVIRDRLRWYSRGDVFSSISDLTPWHTNIKDLVYGFRMEAESEGVSFLTIRDRARWYTNSGVISSLSDISNGIMNRDFLLGAKLGGSTWGAIKDQLQDAVNIMGNRDREGTVFGDLAKTLAWIKALLVSHPGELATYDMLAYVMEILLRLDGLTGRLENILGRFR